MPNGFGEQQHSHDESSKCSKTIQAKLKRSLLMKGVSESSNQKCVRKISNEDWPCGCQKTSWEDYPTLKTILPLDYDYRVCSYHGDDTGGFKSMLRLPHLTDEKILDWKSELETRSFCLFRVCRTFPGSGRYNTFKTDYSCQHNTSRGRGKLATKKTGCKAELSVTVKRVVKKSRSSDRHLPELPTTIFLRWYHNHPLDAIESMRFCDVSEDTTKELMTLYHQGHSPASAYLHYKSKVLKERGEKSFESVSKDRRILPEKPFVYRLFAKMKKQKGTDSNSNSSPSAFEPSVASQRPPVDVVLPAAGTSTRMRTTASSSSSNVPKQFQKVLGTHLIAYTIASFHRLPWIRHIVLVVGKTEETFARDLMRDYGWFKVKVCTGSESRHRSIRNGIRALKDDCYSSSVVVIHDGARPFVPEEIIDQVVKMAGRHGAAGVVRPLVSTVIKPDTNDALESTLTRSDYRNSEMPQAFQYGIIAQAYDKCNDHDLDHGTECLLLALQYSQCPARLVDGCPDLWKVTYAKDLFTMESVVKEKGTRVCLLNQTRGPCDYLDRLKAGLEERHIKLCNSEKEEGTNTVLCFVEHVSISTSSSSSSSSTPLSSCVVTPHILDMDWDTIKQVSCRFNSLSWLEKRLGLFVILVVLYDPSRLHSHTQTVPEGATVTTTTTASCISSSSSSSSMQTAAAATKKTFSPQKSTPFFVDQQQSHLIQNTHQILPQQQQQQQQTILQPQQQHLHVQQQQHEQQPLQHNLHVSMVLSDVPCSNDRLYSINSSTSFNTQQQPPQPPPRYLDSNNFHHQTYPLSTLSSSSSSNNNNNNSNNNHQQTYPIATSSSSSINNNNNNQHHLHSSPSPFSTQQPHQHHQYLLQQQHQQQQQHPLQFQDRPPHPGHSYTTLNNIPIRIKPPTEQNSFSQLRHGDPCKASSMLTKTQPSNDTAGSHGRGITTTTTDWELLTSTTPRGQSSNPNRDEETGPESVIPQCQERMRQLRQLIQQESTPNLCIASVICGTGRDPTDKLVEMVWSRSRFLDGQVLLFTDLV